MQLISGSAIFIEYIVSCKDYNRQFHVFLVNANVTVYYKSYTECILGAYIIIRTFAEIFGAGFPGVIRKNTLPIFR